MSFECSASLMECIEADSPISQEKNQPLYHTCGTIICLVCTPVYLSISHVLSGHMAILFRNRRKVFHNFEIPY